MVAVRTVPVVVLRDVNSEAKREKMIIICIYIYIYSLLILWLKSFILQAFQLSFLCFNFQIVILILNCNSK